MRRLEVLLKKECHGLPAGGKLVFVPPARGDNALSYLRP